MGKIGNMIKRQRLRLGMSQKELADKVGVSKSAISRYESGSIGNMGVDKARLMAEALKIDPVLFLMAESDHEKTDPYLIYQDDDFTLTSSSRKLEDEQTLRQALLICTSPVDDRPSREDMLYWLRENVRSAAFTGANYEDRDDESLYRLYKELKAEAERIENTNSEEESHEEGRD